MSALTMSPRGAVLPAAPGRRGMRPRGVPASRPAQGLTRRGRLVLAVIAVTLVGGGLGLGRAVAEGPPAAIEVATYTVVPGDTLWSIASGVNAAGQDVRDVIATIQDLNNMTDSALAAGAQLLLPAP